MASDKLSTPKALLSFPTLKEPKQVQGKGEPMFSAALIFDPKAMSPRERELWRALKRSCMEAIIDKFGEKAVSDAKKFKLKPGYAWPFRDAEEKEQYEGFEAGKIYIQAKTLRRPALGMVKNVGGKLKAVDTDDLELFYPGASVIGKLSPWAYDNVTKGVRLTLEALTFVQHGERLDGVTTSAEDAFADDDFDDLDIDMDDLEDEDIEDDDDDDEDEDFS